MSENNENENNNNNVLITTEAKQTEVRDLGVGETKTTTTTKIINIANNRATNINSESSILLAENIAKFPLIQATLTKQLRKFPIENVVNYKDNLIAGNGVVIANDAALMLKLANTTNLLKANLINDQNYDVNNDNDDVGNDNDGGNFLPKDFRQFPFIYNTYYHKQQQQQQQFPLENLFLWQNNIMAKEILLMTTMSHKIAPTATTSKTITKIYDHNDNLIMPLKQRKQQLKLIFPLQGVSNNLIQNNNNKNFPLYKNDSKDNNHFIAKTVNLWELKKNAIENHAIYLKTIGYGDQVIAKTTKTTTTTTKTKANTQAGIIYHVDFYKQFPIKCANDNLRKFPITNTEANKSLKTYNNKNNTISKNIKSKKKNPKYKVYKKQKYSNNEHGMKNNNINKNIEKNIETENKIYKNYNDGEEFWKNSINKSMTPLKIGKEEKISADISIQNNEPKDQKEEEEEEEAEDKEKTTTNLDINFVSNGKIENQVHMFNSNNNNNNKNENDKFIVKMPLIISEQQQEPSKQIEKNVSAEIDKKNLIMKAKVENIEKKPINKILVEEQQQLNILNDSTKIGEELSRENTLMKIKVIRNEEKEEEEKYGIKCEHKHQSEITMMVTSFMCANNINEKQQQQPQELIEKDEHLTFSSNKSLPMSTRTTPLEDIINYDSNNNNNKMNNNNNNVKPEQRQQQSQQAEKEKQSEQLNESTPTRETTMMMMMRPNITQIILSSYADENSDVRDQLSQEDRENLRKQYNNKVNIDSNIPEENSTLASFTSKTTTTSRTPSNNNKNINNTFESNEINDEQHVVNSTVNNNNNINWQESQKAIIDEITIIESDHKNKLREVNDDKNFEESKEMKIEMRSALANNNNNNNNNKNNNNNNNNNGSSIIFKQHQEKATHKIPDVRLSTTTTTTSVPVAHKYALPSTTTQTPQTTATSATKYHNATHIPSPLTAKTTGIATTTTTAATPTATTRTYIPINNNVNNVINRTSTTSNDRSMSLDTSLILPERTRLRRQRRMLSQGSTTEQTEDPVERLNRLRARISGALSQVKGVLKQYSTDADANDNEEETNNSTNFDAFKTLRSNRLKEITERHEKSEPIAHDNLKNDMPMNAENPEMEMEMENEGDRPVNFRFVRKVRRRSIFNENEEINMEKAQNSPPSKDEKVIVNADDQNNMKMENEAEAISEIQENLPKEQNNIIMEEKTNESETKCHVQLNGENLEEKTILEINGNTVKKPAKKRIVVIKKSKATGTARRASIAAVESSKIEPTVQKLLPLNIKAQRRPSDSEAIVNKKMLVYHNENSLRKNQLNDIDSGICEIGSMEELEKNAKKMLKVDTKTNATPSVSHIKTHENVANDIGVNNDYTYDNNNNNNNNNINENNNNVKNDNKNNVIISNANENENSNKDNNKNNTTMCSDIALMPVNCSTPTLSSGEETSITIVKLIDDAEKLLGVTAGDNVNFSMNNKDSTNQIIARQLVEDATRTSTKLDDKQSTAMVAMLMLSPLQDVVKSSGTSKTIEDIPPTINSDCNHNNNKNYDNKIQPTITETILQESIENKGEEEKLNANKNKIQVHVIKQVSKVTSEQKKVAQEEEEAETNNSRETALGENIPIELKTITKDSIKLQDHSSSSTSVIAATAKAPEPLSELTSIEEAKMPELQAVPVPVQLTEHNNKLRNAEPPFNDVTKDDYGKKRVVLKKIICKSSIDKATGLKKINKIHVPKVELIEPSAIEEVAEKTDSENQEAAEGEATVVEECTVNDIVPIKPPRKVKKKVIIKRQQRRLSVSDTGFFREPINDEQTDGTASDVEILEKPISYVTDDEADDENNSKKILENADDDVVPEEPAEPIPLKSCMRAREFQVDDWVMYAERFKKTMVRWKKGRVIERITSISYKLDIDGKEVPAHISYIKKYTDRKVNFGGKEYLEINYEQIEQENNAARSYSIWNMV